MSDRREFVKGLGGAFVAGLASGEVSGTGVINDDRKYWLSVVKRVAEPVLVNLAKRQLRQSMPVESFSGKQPERRAFSHLEAAGRLLAGLAPWLELTSVAGEEKTIRDRYADLARAAIDAATDPSSPDFMNFTTGRQPLVDAAFLTHAMMRAPTELWQKLAPKTQANVIAALKSTRSILPYPSNWLLFGAMIEAGLASIGLKDWDKVRVDYAVR